MEINERLAVLEERYNHLISMVAGNAKLTESIADTVKRHANAEEVRVIEAVQREQGYMLIRHDENITLLKTRVDKTEIPRWRQYLSGGQSATHTVDNVKHPVRLAIIYAIVAISVLLFTYRVSIIKYIDRQFVLSEQQDSLRLIVEIERLRSEQQPVNRQVGRNTAKLDTVTADVDTVENEVDSLKRK